MNPITLRVQVTATDIAYGKPESCFACPVARAINRAASTYRLGGATVSKVAARIGSHPEIPLPREAVARIFAFDRSGVMAPFEFSLTFGEAANASDRA